MKILIGISGGFDSAFTALKLMRQGHTVEGAVLKMHEHTDIDGAIKCAESLGIPLYIIDCTAEFNTVINNFINEYKNARTPNPCIICNREVKFKCLLDFALENGFDKIATGHYARVVEYVHNGKSYHTLAVARDTRKDQTYMLYRLTEQTLSHLILPMGDELKADLRENSPAELAFVSEKGDSQEICFIPDDDYAGYIEERIGAFPEGDFVDENNNVIGRHKGLVRYTIGQRKGLGIPSLKKLYVTSIDAVNNVVRVSPDIAYSTVVRLTDVVCRGLPEVQTADGEYAVVDNALVKLRYQAPLVGATAHVYKDGTATLYLSEPVKSVTPGQSAVAYSDGTVLFGGVISSAE